MFKTTQHEKKCEFPKFLTWRVFNFDKEQKGSLIDTQIVELAKIWVVTIKKARRR